MYLSKCRVVQAHLQACFDVPKLTVQNDLSLTCGAPVGLCSTGSTSSYLVAENHRTRSSSF